MRASGFLFVTGFLGVSVLAIEACTYSSSGQGGTAGALWFPDGAVAEAGATDNDATSSTGGGSGGGFGGGSSGGDNGNGSSSGVSNGGGGDDGGSNCPPGTFACGAAGCCGEPIDSAPTPPQCAPADPSFLQACESFYQDRNAGDPCSSCVNSAETTCSAKATDCQSGPSCEATCETKLGCTVGETGGDCPIAELCSCIYDCLSPIGDTCCGPAGTSFFTCAVGQCSLQCDTVVADAQANP